jgi:hypothetical protein
MDEKLIELDKAIGYLELAVGALQVVCKAKRVDVNAVEMLDYEVIGNENNWL